jgi:hypothetical protein
MGIMFGYAIRDYLNVCNKHYEWGLVTKTTSTTHSTFTFDENHVYPEGSSIPSCTILGYAGLQLKSNDCPCLVVNVTQPIMSGPAQNLIDRCGIILYYNLTGDLEKYDILTKKIKNLFIKPQLLSYNYEGVNYESIIQYTNADDTIKASSRWADGSVLYANSFTLMSPRAQLSKWNQPNIKSR